MPSIPAPSPPFHHGDPRAARLREQGQRHGRRTERQRLGPVRDPDRRHESRRVLDGADNDGDGDDCDDAMRAHRTATRRWAP